MLKHFGHSHDPCGTNATEPASCAVLCPACPHPRKNLPADWIVAPPEQRYSISLSDAGSADYHNSWLYQLFIGINANFCLKQYDISSDGLDPGLNRGCAYFVEDTTYRGHLVTHNKNEPAEKSSCNNHKAVKLSNMRGSTCTAASGIGTVECVCHDMKWPCSVENLQKGEW